MYRRENAEKDMFKLFENKTKEECMCDKYTQLMHRAYKLALVDKEESDRVNAKAKKILRELRRMNYDKIDS
ncbi:Lacal_2735 family protein [Salegentibacter chungangensis]|uniref:Lacal_2735 family protein n=1 Tax=Salegentibacter chungangensis TaxID=1335724 RepID=A0ABW3NRV8_9FLAO